MNRLTFTAMDDVELRDAEIEHTIVLEGSKRHDPGRCLAESLIGRKVRINRLPLEPIPAW